MSLLTCGVNWEGAGDYRIGYCAKHREIVIDARMHPHGLFRCLGQAKEESVFVHADVDVFLVPMLWMREKWKDEKRFDVCSKLAALTEQFAAYLARTNDPHQSASRVH
jgi:hypothetical protein